MAKTIKVLGWTITLILVLSILGLGLIYLLPDYDLLLVRSQSMEPAVKMGDMIITGPLNGPINGDIKPGTIVTYLKLGKVPITHRVLSIDGEKLVMKGDAVEDPDPWPVTISDVKGVYLFKIPYAGFVLYFIRTKLGWFLSIIIPAAVLIGWLCRDILKEAFSKPQKTSDENIRDILIEAPDNAHEASKDWEVTSMVKQKET